MEEAFMDLSTLRNEIDRIDSQLVQLYEQRMEICSQVAEYKIENGKKVFDKTREEEKLARVRSLTHNDFNSQGVTELFEQIMAMSRKLQYQMLESHGRTGRLPFIPVENLDTKKASRISGRRGRIFPGCDDALFRGTHRQHPCGQLPGRNERDRRGKRGVCGSSN